MGIEIKCFVTLTKFLPENAGDFPIDADETVLSLINRLGIPENEVAIIFVNNLRSPVDTSLSDGDRVGLFPAVGGG